MVDVRHTAFLPAPRVPFGHDPRLPDPGWLDELHPGGGDFVRAWLGIFNEVVEAIDVLESSRPGGALWQEALAADAAAVTTGKQPRSWRTAELLRSDPDRWAHTSALARTMVVRVNAVRASAPTRDLAAAAMARWEALRQPLAEQAEVAWLAADAGDPGPAWTALAAVEHVMGEASRIRGVAAWAQTGADEYVAAGWPAPWTPSSRGHYLSAAWTMRPNNRPTMLPQGVDWPAGSIGERGARDLAARGIATRV